MSRRPSPRLLTAVAVALSLGACATPPTGPDTQTRLSRPRFDQTAPKDTTTAPQDTTTHGNGSGGSTQSGYQNPVG